MLSLEVNFTFECCMVLTYFKGNRSFLILIVDIQLLQ